MATPVQRLSKGVGKALLFAGLSLALTEGAVRLFTTRDRDGQLYFQGGRLKPYKLPAATVGELLEEYRRRPDSYLVYHPLLGWTPRPGSVSRNRLYRSNSAGLRSHREYELTPPAGVLRIALFGDSFTHGDGISYEQSWAFRLEALLARRGIAAEVLNFGVGGYGMDQAYLRWQIEGSPYRPDVVVFGFAPSNVARNLNIFRCIRFSSTNIPFSKPRFVSDGGQLRLVNSPTVPVGEIVPTLADFRHSPLAEYEYFYAEQDYAEHWWLESRLLSVAGRAWSRRSARERPSDVACRDLGEPAKTAKAIVAAFAAGVEAGDARFLVVHLPQKSYMRRYHATGRFCYDGLLRHFDKRYPLIRVENYFTDPEYARYFAGHYSAEGNELVAAAVAEGVGQVVPRQVVPRQVVPRQVVPSQVVPRTAANSPWSRSNPFP